MLTFKEQRCLEGITIVSVRVAVRRQTERPKGQEAGQNPREQGERGVHRHEPDSIAGAMQQRGRNGLIVRLRGGFALD